MLASEVCMVDDEPWTGPALATIELLGVPLSATSYEDATGRILDLVRAQKPGFVCAANVHMVMEAQDDPNLMEALHHARLVTPDGMPLVWWLRRLGAPGQPRVYGPTLMWRLCERCSEQGIRIGLYGARPEVLARLSENLRLRFPGIQIVYEHSPPLGIPTDQLDEVAVQRIAASRCQVLFVGLGCPKQELWMYRHRERIGAVMLGVGAAFDFHAGFVRQAPAILQENGLEWAFRLCMEPRRLWKRYLKHNPRFVWSTIAHHGLRR